MLARVRMLTFALLLAALAAGPVWAESPFTLDSVRAQVKKDYGQVQHLPTQTLAEKLKQRDGLLVLDVREEAEYAVSRIPGAVRVDPGIWRRSFLNRFGEMARGKTVVFYCSVGVRSSRLAAAVQDALKEQGARGVFNLDGGIFAWHNEGRALVNAQGPTRFVHSFDSRWGKLIDHTELIRTAPRR